MWHGNLEDCGELEAVPCVLPGFEETQAFGEGIACLGGRVVEHCGGEELNIVLQTGVGVDELSEEAACGSEGEEDRAWEVGEDADNELGGEPEEERAHRRRRTAVSKSQYDRSTSLTMKHVSAVAI